MFQLLIIVGIVVIEFCVLKNILSVNVKDLVRDFFLQATIVSVQAVLFSGYWLLLFFRL